MYQIGYCFYNLELRMAVFTRRISALDHLVARAGKIFSIGRFDSLDTGAAGVVKFEGIGVQDVVVLGGGGRRPFKIVVHSVGLCLYDR